jgi:CheY-like chemotaxis protein
LETVTMEVGRPAVLLVDDSKDEREMWTEFLRQQGFHPVHAATSEEALRLAAASPPDVVVVDLVLPGSMNGLELTPSLEARPGNEAGARRHADGGGTTTRQGPGGERRGRRVSDEAVRS